MRSPATTLLGSSLEPCTTRDALSCPRSATPVSLSIRCSAFSIDHMRHEPASIVRDAPMAFADAKTRCLAVDEPASKDGVTAAEVRHIIELLKHHALS